VGRTFFRRGNAVMIPEPFALVTPLPACANCGAIHPLARRPKLDVDDCPDCGHPLAELVTTEVPAALTGLWGLLFNLCTGLAKLLAQAGRRLKGM
jgi:hypothetical protein